MAKQAGRIAPWSQDKVFQETYFCNVRREDDKVTKFIRERYTNPEDNLFEFNIVLARFLNWIPTLKILGYVTEYHPVTMKTLLESIALEGQVWGNAYIITTHGMPMPKLHYLCFHVLSDVHKALETIRMGCRGPTCKLAWMTLQEIEGIGSFLAGQIVADLKNTVGHPLNHAFDKSFFVAHGPGSLRGVHWFRAGVPGQVAERNFPSMFKEIREYVDANWPDYMPPIDNQDLQNCLCEYDKYCRIATGVGRSKRKYNGS